MKAIGVHSSLPVSNQKALEDLELPDPKAAGRDLLVRVKAVSVNPVDTKIRMSVGASAAQPRVLGWDCAGIVEAVGPEAILFKPGDEVYYAGDVTRPGCNSELHLVDERIVGHKPPALDFEEAAAMPLTTITAWEAMFDRMGIARTAEANAGRSILIIGGAGGVGSIAIQLARLAGLRVIATASREETQQWCRDMGAEVVVNHHNSLLDEFKEQGIDGADYIFCTSGPARYWHDMADLIKPQGKLCLIVDSESNQPLNINLFKPKSATIVWEFMFTRPRFQTADMAAQGALLNEAAALLEKGELRHTLTERAGELNALNLRQAHARLESGSMIGKLVLSVP